MHYSEDDPDHTGEAEAADELEDYRRTYIQTKGFRTSGSRLTCSSACSNAAAANTMVSGRSLSGAGVPYSDGLNNDSAARWRMSLLHNADKSPVEGTRYSVRDSLARLCTGGFGFWDNSPFAD